MEFPLKLLNDFLPQLTHAGNFFTYLNLNDLDDLINFLSLEEPELAEVLKKHKSHKFIFHGSNRKLEVISPKVATGGKNKNKHKSLVYATTLPDYAIFKSCLNQTDESSCSVMQDGQYTISKLRVDDAFINGSSTLKRGYVYVFSSKHFSVNRDNLSEWFAEEEVKPLFYIKAYIYDLRTPISIKDRISKS